MTVQYVPLHCFLKGPNYHDIDINILYTTTTYILIVKNTMQFIPGALAEQIKPMTYRSHRSIMLWKYESIHIGSQITLHGNI